ncbi:MAG: hypothetical protein MUF49_18145 [Oculatellaceae cyanobacterium Prado106]|nr:hypothetical protein [Oculatellaceae cyanobacterium Prado106]
MPPDLDPSTPVLPTAVLPPLEPSAIQSTESPDDYFQKQGYAPSSIKLTTDHQYEDPEERQARLKREELELNHKHRKEMMGYGFGMMLVMMLLITNTIALFNQNASKEIQASAQATMAAIATAAVGYLFGKGHSSH